MKKMISLMLALALMACEPLDHSGLEPYEEELTHEMMVLGEQLEDPYSVKNITKALESLYPTKAGSIKIDPTDLYVRFLPETEEECKRLEDRGLTLFDHPLDFRIVRDGDYYHDPGVSQEKVTWMYAVVESDFVAPSGIRYEILDKCYIVENDKTETKSSTGIDWREVERESYRLTGNGEMLLPQTKGGESNTPSGRITIVDDQKSQEPFGVAGVMVSCNRFVKVAKTYTDEKGMYTMEKSFDTDVRYRLKFKNTKGFAMGVNLLIEPCSSSALGKGSPSGLSVTIDKDSDRKLFTRCVVNNAAYDYYSQCKNSSGTNIKTPPSNLRIWLFQHLKVSSAVMLQQGAIIDRSVIGDFLGEYASLVKMFLPDITLGLKGKDDYGTIYRAAMHELAHASHFMVVGKSWWDTYIKFVLKSFVTNGGEVYGSGAEDDAGYCEVAEMWAYYVESRMYRERYPDDKSVFGTNNWFSPQVFMSMDEKGLDRYGIFQALTSDVHDKDVLQDKLLSLYPQYKSIINQAFNRYK